MLQGYSEHIFDMIKPIFPRTNDDGPADGIEYPNIRHHCSWPNSHVFLVKSSFVMAKSLTGWWLSHPSEKYESQLGLFPTEWKNKIHVTNHQPVKFLDDLSFHGQIPPCVFLKSPFVVKFLLLAMERAAENG